MLACIRIGEYAYVYFFKVKNWVRTAPKALTVRTAPGFLPHGSLSRSTLAKKKLLVYASPVGSFRARALGSFADGRMAPILVVY